MKEELTIIGIITNGALPELRFNLPDAGPVDYEIHDLAGRQVHSGSPGRMEAGHHVMLMGTESLPPGIYSLVLRASQEVVSARLLLY